MVTALQQADQEENRDGSHNTTQLIHSYANIKYAGKCKSPKTLILFESLISQGSFVSFTLTAKAPEFMLSYPCKTTNAGIKLGYFMWR